MTQHADERAEFEQMRESFEAEIIKANPLARTTGCLVTLGNHYTDPDCEGRWDIWKRAWQAARRAPVVPQRCDLCKNNGGYFYGRTGYEPCCVGSLAPQPPEADHIPDAGKMVAAPMQIPENIREGEPYDNPAFEALARALGVWGTAQSAVCAQFWIAAKEQST